MLKLSLVDCIDRYSTDGRFPTHLRHEGEVKDAAAGDSNPEPLASPSSLSVMWSMEKEKREERGNQA